jgi:hypothetical protein
MATFDYQEMADAATELLDEFGSAVTLIRNNNGAGDPVTGNYNVTDPVTPATVSYTTIGLKTYFKDSQIDGTRILASDILVVVNASVKPVVGDVVQIDSVNIGTVVNDKIVEPTDIPLCYFVQVRK